ncbi:MAG: hypothetical protein AAB809_00460 [Patescibacteria group bacterium]
MIKILLNKNSGPSHHSGIGGYTIIETMIAVSLFIVITTISMGALLNANMLHRKAQSMRSIMDNLNFVMEDMSRNLRIGYNYRCFPSGQSIPTGDDSSMDDPRSCASGWAIAFEYAYGNPSINAYNDQWVYYISGSGKIFKSTSGPYNSASFTQLTPDEVVIDTSASSFSVLGAESITTNSQQPFVTIKLVGKITYQNVDTPFSLQTSVSQRLIDI